MIIDGSFVDVPRQRNMREENKRIKDDKGDELWQEEESDSDKEKKHKANKRRHKDIHARWTKKGVREALRTQELCQGRRQK